MLAPILYSQRVLARKSVAMLTTPDKVNAACGKEGAPGQQGFVAGKIASKGAAAFVNHTG